ncbi:CNP1-like family protein [Chitinibacteraceae bacterium HSL-7]
MKTAQILAALLAAALSTTALASAATGESGMDPNANGGGDGSFLRNILSDGPLPPPKEGEFVRPDLATLKVWQPYTVNFASRDNDFFVALDSITVSEDGIVRYAAAIVPKKGDARNVSFEGLDCDSGQYRIYAWGDSEGKNWVESTRGWKRLMNDQSRNAYQRQLYDDMCATKSARSADDIRGILSDRRKKAVECPGCGQQ